MKRADQKNSDISYMSGSFERQIYDMKASDGYYYKAGYFWSNDSLVVFGDSVPDMFSNLDRRQVGYLAQYDMNMELTNLALGFTNSYAQDHVNALAITFSEGNRFVYCVFHSDGDFLIKNGDRVVYSEEGAGYHIVKLNKNVNKVHKKHFIGSENKSQMVELSTDNNGNITMLGNFKGELLLPDTTLTTINNNINQTFVINLSPELVCNWTLKLDGFRNEQCVGTDMKISPSDDILISGFSYPPNILDSLAPFLVQISNQGDVLGFSEHFSEKENFGISSKVLSDTGGEGLILMSSRNMKSTFVLKFDANLKSEIVCIIHDSLSHEPAGMLLDENNNIYILSKRKIDSHSVYYNLFLYVFHSNGELISTANLDTMLDHYTGLITQDEAGNIVLVSGYRSALADSICLNVLAVSNSDSIYTARFSDNMVTPGDANNTGQVNLLDVATTQVSLEKKVPRRMDTTTTPTPKPALRTTQKNSHGLDPIIADANGDGIVDNRDIQVVKINASPIPDYVSTPDGIPFNVAITTTGYRKGDTVSIHLVLEKQESVHFLGVSIKLDTFHFNALTAELIFPGTEHYSQSPFSMLKSFSEAGIVDVIIDVNDIAIVPSFNEGFRSESTEIAIIKVVLKENIAEVETTDLTANVDSEPALRDEAARALISTRSAVAIDAQGNKLPVAYGYQQPVSVDDYDNLSTNSITVSPNPVQESLIISVKEPVPAEVWVTDLQGQIVHLVTFLQASGNVNATTLDIAHLPAGCYLLHYQTKSATNATTFMKR